jgi:hypothetical protein
MKIISKINTAKLVKGMTYDVIKLNNSSQRKSGYYIRKFVEVKLNENTTYTFSVNNFTTENGDPLPEIDWTSEQFKNKIQEYESTKITPETIKAGDYVVYLRKDHVGLITGKKYKINNVKINNYNRWADIEIQIEGSHRYYKSYSFRKCTVEEVRKMSLGVFFDEKPDVQKIDYNKRKIDQFDEEQKVKILSALLFTSSLDRNRNNLSVVEWAIQKTGKSYKLTPEDFESIANLTLKEILELM